MGLGDILGVFAPQEHDPFRDWLYDQGWDADYFVDELLGDIIQEYVDVPTPEDNLTQGLLVNKKSNTAFIPVVYGSQRIGGTIAFMTTTGANNDYLHIVLILCEGEIEAIDNVYIDDILSTDSQFSGLVRVNSYVGTDSQVADADLVSEVTDWTTAHTLSGVAYVYVRLQWNRNAFTRLPAITADVRGKLVKDIRNSPHTTAYSTNPALCIRDYLTDTRYGKGLDESVIDDTAIAAAANYCDEQVVQDSDASPQVMINRFSCDGVVDTGRKIFDNIKALLTSCNGWLPVIAGNYTLLIDKVETDTSPSTVFTFDEDNIVGSWSFKKKGKSTRYNRITTKFRNPDRNWQYDVIVEDNPTLRLTEDNNHLLKTDLPLPFDISPYRAAYKAEVALKHSRQGIFVSFVATSAAMQTAVGDVVYITHATPGWTQKLFRISSLQLRNDGLVAVSLKEYDATVYDRTVPAEYPTAPDTNLPNPFSVTAPTNMVLDSGTDVLYVRNDGTIITRIYVTWTPSLDIYVTEYVLEYKQSASSTWIVGGIIRGLNASEFYILDVDDGENYDIRIKAVNNLGIESDYLTETDYTVVGKTEPPPDCDLFTVQRQADGTREFSGGLMAANVPADFAGYKIRAGLDSGSPIASWDNLTDLHDGLVTSLPWETNQLSAGQYTFAIKAVDTTGNESTNALYTNTTLGDPRLRGALLAVDPRVLGWPGTKTSCFVDSDGRLVATDQETWATFATNSPVETWADWTTWARDPNSPIIYEHGILDAGVVTTFTPLVSVVATAGASITIEESHSDGDTSPWSWSSYAAVGGQITARYVKIRVTVSHASSLVIVNSMSIILDAETVSELIEDLDTSTISTSPNAAGVVRLPITQSYDLIRRVSVVLQNVGAGWTWELIDKNTSLGPKIHIYNASNTLADAIIDAEVVGL